MIERIGTRLAVAAIAIGLWGNGDAAVAGPAFDGRWFIDASCSSLFCPIKRKRLIAHVRGGQIARIEGLPGEATGVVNADGGVVIRIRLYGVTAFIWGRIDPAGGAGDWSSDSSICSRGAWRAVAAR